jgi:hypothetical protein
MLQVLEAAQSPTIKKWNMWFIVIPGNDLVQSARAEMHKPAIIKTFRYEISCI